MLRTTERQQGHRNPGKRARANARECVTKSRDASEPSEEAKKGYKKPGIEVPAFATEGGGEVEREMKVDHAFRRVSPKITVKGSGK